MNYQNLQLEKAYNQWLSRDSWDGYLALTLSLKQGFSEGGVIRPIDDTEASRNMRFFLNQLNCRCLGGAARRYGRRLQVIPVIGGGNESQGEKRFHNHLIIEIPKYYEHDQFIDGIRHCWLKTPYGHRQIESEDIRDEGWLGYILNSSRQHRIDVNNLSWS